MRKLILLTTLAVAGAVPAGAAVAATTAPSGTLHVSIVTTSRTAPSACLIAWGPISGAGTFTFTNTGGIVKLPSSSFAVTTPSNVNGTVNPTTCLYTNIFSTHYKLSAGTGAYTDVRGSGTVKLTEYAVLPKVAGKCNQNGNPSTFQFTIEAAGPVQLP